jgi:hypothetical protein
LLSPHSPLTAKGPRLRLILTDERIRQHINSLDYVPFLVTLMMALRAKYNNYHERCMAWRKRAFERLVEIHEELRMIYSNGAGIPFHEWRAARDTCTRRVKRQNEKRFTRWERKARVAKPPSPAELHRAAGVACTDVAAIIRAMMVKIRQPATLSFI